MKFKRKHFRYKKRHRKKKGILPYLLGTGVILVALYVAAKGISITNIIHVTISRLLPVTILILAAVLCMPLLYKLWHHIRYRTCDLYRIDRMSGSEFEEYLAYLFRKKGYSVKHTPASGDYGADLILENKTDKGIKERTVVQAKRYRGNVGVAAVQEVIGAMHYYEADKAMVITNSLFTPNAQKLAKKSNVVLWDRWQLKRNLK